MLPSTWQADALGDYHNISLFPCKRYLRYTYIAYPYYKSKTGFIYNLNGSNVK